MVTNIRLVVDTISSFLMLEIYLFRRVFIQNRIKFGWLLTFKLASDTAGLPLLLLHVIN